ncbi:MAG: ribbon-helix-helix domain-containing protein [Elusimicrobiota bacterium]
MSTATVNISFPKGLLKAIDEVAQEESRTRSDLLREATRRYIDQRRRLGRVFAFWKSEAKALGLKPADAEKAVQHVRSAK